MYACTMDGRTCWTNAQRGRYRKAVGGRNGKEPQVCFPGIEWALFAQKGRSRVQRSFQETYIPQPINPFYHNPCPIVRTLNRKGWKFLGGEFRLSIISIRLISPLFFRLSASSLTCAKSCRDFKPFSQPPALSHAQGHHLFISAQSFAGYKSLFWDYRSSRTSRSIHIRQSRVALLRQRILQ